MIIAGTGHRPDKIRLGTRDAYHHQVHSRLVDLARAVLQRKAPTRVISGMAQGWDTALAIAAVDLGIAFDAYVPFEGQESRWPAAAQRRYRDLLSRAATVVIVCEGGYSVEKMQTRNERMVDDSDLVVALWNGTPGGTRNCIDYAETVGRRWENQWRFWLRHAGPRSAVAAAPTRLTDPVFEALLADAGGVA